MDPETIYLLLIGLLSVVVAGYWWWQGQTSKALQAVIKGVSEIERHAGKPASKLVKGDILRFSEELGVKAVLDDFVQKYDPPKRSP